jgi:flagellar L-ring protein precursor FlgH
MKNYFDNMVAGLLVLMLYGCAAPSTSIQTPMTARPAERVASIPHNGAIFQAGRNEHPLFEDKRARNVGDILTINIVESTKASESTSNSASHAGSINASTPTLTKGVTTTTTTGQTILNPFNISDASNGNLDNKSANAGAHTFTGTMAVTVIEVMPNGNLLVGGEKLVAINQNNEYIRLSGVIDPVTITATNTVLSTQVADVHLEYKGSNNNLDKAQMMGMIGRAFLSLLPF